jgi:hypothetical protein
VLLKTYFEPGSSLITNYSAGDKIDIWAASMLTRKGGQPQPRLSVVLIYEKERPNGEKNKNGNTGRMAMRELVDPNRNGSKGKSRLCELVGDANYMTPTGDTGNGFRGLPMCWYYTALWLLYGLVVEFIPLPPRHAYNCADALLARLNTFFRKLMRLTYLFGALQFFTALQKATDPRLTGARRLLQRLTPIYCTWTEGDFIPVPKMIKSIDEAVVSPDGSSTNSLGVMELGYFLCTVKT